MPILDLVTPWAAAARGDADELATFARRHADVLEPIRRQRAPTEASLPAPTTWANLAERAGDTALHQAIRDARDRLVDRGLAAPKRIVLVASGAPGGAFEAIPEPGAETIALFVDRLGVSGREGAAAPNAETAVASAMAALTRWTTPGNPVAAIAVRGGWDRWEAAREVRLAEWVYAAGLGVHAAETLGAAPAEALGISEGALNRLRQHERTLQSRLEADLDRAGMGLALRWLEDDAPVAMRRGADGTTLPPGAGRYLGWRMLAARVERVGLAEAAGMSS